MANSGNSNYSRVSTAEDESSNMSQSTSARANPRSPSERLTDKAIALVWVFLAFLVGRWVKFWDVIVRDPRANRNLMSLAFILLGVNTVLLLYLGVYLPRWKGLTDSGAWQVYCPRVVPCMTAVGVACSFVLVRATWPVWGFLAPLVLGVEFLGFLFGLHFVPWC